MRQLRSRPSLLGAVLAVLVGLLIYIYLGSASAADAVPVANLERIPVLTAVTSIDQRDQIAAADVTVRMLPAEAVHPLALTEVEQASGKFATSNLLPGEQILQPHVADLPGGGRLSNLLRDGRRALSVAVSDAIAVGGLLEPGDRVDVLAVFQESRAGWSGSSQMVQDVEVLAVSEFLLGATEEQDDDGNRRSNPTSLAATVTLAVTAYEAQLIALADEFGDLRLVLRAPDDEQTSPLAPLPLDLVLPIEDDTPPIEAATPPPALPEE